MASALASVFNDSPERPVLRPSRVLSVLPGPGRSETPPF